MITEKRLEIIKFILTLCISLVTLFIFSNSLKGSEASTQDSDFFIRIIESIFGKTDLNLHFIVRKAAHMAEFALLSLLVSGWVFLQRIPRLWMGYGLFYVLAVAVTDEFIQTFTGRTGAVSDVLIDFSGALIGVMIALLCRKLKHISHNKLTISK